MRFRVDGVLREVMSIPHKLQSGIIARLKVIASLNIAERRIPQDGRFSVRIGGSKVDLRAATLPTAYGKIVLRLLDTSNVEANLRKLGFSESAFGQYAKILPGPTALSWLRGRPAAANRPRFTRRSTSSTLPNET